MQYCKISGYSENSTIMNGETDHAINYLIRSVPSKMELVNPMWDRFKTSKSSVPSPLPFELSSFMTTVLV